MLVQGFDDKRLRAKPAVGRSLRDILLHVLEADKSYVYALVGVLKTMGEPMEPGHGHHEHRHASGHA